MIDIIWGIVCLGSTALVWLGLWGCKSVVRTSVEIRYFPTHTTIENKGETPIKVRLKP